ncbi:MAG: hypothetical protein AAF493_20655, partial [Pseudomonadota bacterium]
GLLEVVHDRSVLCELEHEAEHHAPLAPRCEGVGGTYGLVEEGEDIRVHAVSFDEALAWLQSGRIINAKTVILLQWLALELATAR